MGYTATTATTRIDINIRNHLYLHYITDIWTTVL